MKNETAIMSIGRFETFPIYFLRAVGIVAWVASYVGTCVSFNGGWDRALAIDTRWFVALIGGIIYQSVFSFGQVGCKSRAKYIDKRWWIAYAACLLFSFIPSFLSYHAYMLPLFIGLGVSAAYIVVSVILMGVDMITEWILFDD